MTVSPFRKLAAAVAALGLLATACGDGSSNETGADSAPTTTAAPTTSVAPTTDTTADVEEDDVAAEPVVEILDQAFLDEVFVPYRTPEYGSFLLSVFDGEGETIQSSIGGDADGRPPTPSAPVRIGSISKVFTSLTVMTLVEEGLVDLDAKAADYVTRVTVPENVTVKNLLRHRSGIYNYTDVHGFFDDVFADETRVWTPEEIVGLVADEEQGFEPGDRFSYSNTNYTILGILIEEVTGEPYHEIVRARITEPLGMDSTYLAGSEEGPALFDPFPGPDETPQPDYDYTSIGTSAWAAGAMVSTGEDLHELFTAIYDGRIVSADSVDQMTDGDDYGLGLELWEKVDGIVGHSGGIPGYFTMIRHSPETGITAFLASTNLEADPGPAIRPMLAALGDADG